MKVLVVGSGGREHALVWKLAQSKKVDRVFAAPGNGGTCMEEKTTNVFFGSGGSLSDPTTEEGQTALLEFVKKENIDLTVVGPEMPLAAGIVDRFNAAGFAILGPGQKTARLETSKVYSKSFMEKHKVRSAASKSFSGFAAALEHSEKHFGGRKGNPVPLVIKADGLAAGKGVVIASNAIEARRALEEFMKKGALGDAGENIVLEQYLEGFEVSVLAAVSAAPGREVVCRPFISAQDHKRRFEGGTGPNTGGMGAIAPVLDFTPEIEKDFVSAIVIPTLKGMEAEKIDYRGFIFFGLMVCEGQCYLLEYNVRLGDPETQAVLPLLDSDFAALCEAILDRELKNFPIKWKAGAVCAPVAAAEGYPLSYRKGDPIAINPTGFSGTGAKLFVAGANRGPGGPLGSGLRTQGGRVLAVSAFGSDADTAFAKAYEALRFINFEGMVYRKDIGRERKSSGPANG